MSNDLRRRELVRDLFDSIASHYDFINTALSFGWHNYWRKVLVDLSGVSSGETVLDLCCGTGRISIDLAKRIGPKGKIVGVDFSEGMLSAAKKNLKKYGLESTIELINADALRLPFPENSFDCCVVGYGLRNFVNLKKALLEIKRILKPGARVVTLELAHPYFPVFKEFYYFYLNRWVPFIGNLLSRNKSAYQYLGRSIWTYPHQYQITGIFREIGFINLHCYELTWGTAAIHFGTKPESIQPTTNCNCRLLRGHPAHCRYLTGNKKELFFRTAPSCS